MDICGIYAIENLVNHKIYIGQSVHIYQRWREHKCYLRNNNHRNLHLQKSWLLYGESNFEFRIIEKCLESELNLKECYYISYYGSDLPENGYNICNGGEGISGHKAPEYVKKLREAHKYQFIPINQFDLNKRKLRHWKSIASASRDLNINASGIRNCANTFSLGKGNNYTYKSFIWVYDYDIDKMNNIDIEEYLSYRATYRVNQYSFPDGVFIKQYHSVFFASKHTNIHQNHIINCIIGKAMSAKGFTFRKALSETDNENIDIVINKATRDSLRKSVIAFDKNLNICGIFDSIQIVGKALNIKNASHISGCCKHNKNRNTFHGYIWKYKEEVDKFQIENFLKCYEKNIFITYTENNPIGG